MSSSAAPMALEAPDAPELAGLALFRSRRVEDGRDRYRLHLGFFESTQSAEQVLPVVRRKYPAAWMALAPKEGMGSLDDTSVAQFKFIPQKKMAPEAAAEPPVLKPAEVLALLESPPRVTPAAPAPAEPTTLATTRSPAKPTAAAAQSAVIDAHQRFAVQLVWAAERVDTGKIPQLGIFDAYTLYTVQVERAGRRWYGLRLGFFSDPISARQVSLYAQSAFPAAAVVPVSPRECERAEDAARAAQKAAPAPRPATTLPTRPVAPITKLHPKPAARAVKTNKPERSAADLLRDLETHEMGFGAAGADELNDTGVRHLSVSVAKHSKPGKRSLFGR